MMVFIGKGGPLMWPLIGLSFLSVTFIIERALFFWGEARKRRRKHVELIFQNVERGRLDRAETVGERAKEDFVVRTLLHGLSHRHHSLTQALETQALIEYRRMKKYLPVLDTIVTAAPLLGILGTVIGIILSFNVLGSGGVRDPIAVTQGISQALITTAFGLSIALVTLVPYNYFQTRCQQGVEELEKSCSTLEIIIQRMPASPVLKDLASAPEHNP